MKIINNTKPKNADEEFLKRMYDEIDVDKNGGLSFDELMAFFKKIKFPAPANKLEEAKKLIEKNPKGMSFTDFLSFWGDKLKHPKTQMFMSEFRRME